MYHSLPAHIPLDSHRLQIAACRLRVRGPLEGDTKRPCRVEFVRPRGIEGRETDGRRGDGGGTGTRGISKSAREFA